MIRKKKNAWEVRIYLGLDPVTGRERTLSRSFPAKPGEKNPPRWVKDEERKLTIEVREGKHVGSDLTVADLCARWLDTLDPAMSPWTVKGYHDKVRLYILPHLGKVKLSKLTTATLDRFYAQLARDGGKGGTALSAQSVRHVHSTLRRALNRAVRWGWVDKNVALMAEPPKVVRDTIHAPTLEDVEKLIEGSVDDPTLHLAVMLAVATGARRGEVCGLQWLDVDEAQAAVRFSRAVVDPDGELIVKQPKTNRARVNAIGEHLLAEIQAHRDRRMVACMAFGIDFDPAGYILSESEDGTVPLSPQVLSKRFARLAKQVGVIARLHDLRHGHVSWLLSAGVPVKDVADRVGHSSARMTLDVYGHALPATDRTSADITDRMLKGR